LIVSQNKNQRLVLRRIQS